MQLNWKECAYKLWGLLDDISTLDDACKSNNAAFRKLVYKKAEERNKYMFSPDGYKLKRVDLKEV